MLDVAGRTYWRQFLLNHLSMKINQSLIGIFSKEQDLRDIMEMSQSQVMVMKIEN